MNDKAIYITGQLFFLGALFIFNTVAARLLGPEQMGIWNLVNLIAEYGFIVTIGIINGMAREIPLSIGKEDYRDVESVTGNSLTILASVVVMLLGVAIFIYDDTNTRTLYYVMGICLLVTRIMNSFAYILIRSWQQFTYLGAQQLLMGVVQFCCLLLFLRAQNLPTVFAITVIPLLVGSGFAVKYLRHFRSMHYDPKVLVKLISTGFPIYMIGLLYSLFGTTDRLLITSYLGVKPLGLYTPAMIAVSIISLAPTFVANIMYPKLTEMYGRTNNYTQLKPFLRRMLQVNIISTLFLSLVIFLAFQLVIIPYFLPEYAVALYPMGILLLGAIVSSVGHGFGDFFNAIGKQRVYLINVICALMVNIIAGVLMLHFTRLEMVGVTLGTLVAVVVYSTLQVVSARKIFDEK